MSYQDNWIVMNLTRAKLADELDALAAEKIEAIDGATESRGRDSALSHEAALLQRAAAEIRDTSPIDATEAQTTAWYARRGYRWDDELNLFTKE